MTGCSILGCKNRTEGGFMLIGFPTDPQRKMLWLQSIGREKWQPNKSCICKIHFASNMWEKPRQDSTKKLRRDAIPTIFPIYEKQLPETTNIFLDEHELQVQKLRTTEGDNEHIEKSISIDTDNSQFEDNSVLFSGSFQSYDQLNDSATSLCNTTAFTLERAVEEIHLLQQKLEDRGIQVKEANEKFTKLQKDHKLKYSNKILMNRVKKFRSTHKLRLEKTILHKVFNDDQTRWLQSDSSKRRISSWSKETIKKALRIKACCTSSGYAQLIKENIPLPSLRTLRRSVEGLDFSSGILDDVFDAMKETIRQFTDYRHCDCMLGLDEVAITPGEQFDSCTNSLIGNFTIPNSRGNSCIIQFITIYRVNDNW
ncbi:uncharacterized protein LOC112590139 isoform X2 [Harpegnathos saltator]|nr:uncharacterized protein LOC112590139 isoform X2 [Harpegnathos saltator]